MRTWVLSLRSGADQFHLQVPPSPEHTSYTQPTKQLLFTLNTLSTNKQMGKQMNK